VILGGGMIWSIHAAKLAVVSNVIAWSSGAVASSDLQSTPVNEDGIAISLPVYIVSLIATAGFTWTISKYDQRRNRRLEVLEHELSRSNDRFIALQAQLEDLLRQGETPKQ